MLCKQLFMQPDNLREKIWRIADGIPLNLDNVTIRIDKAGKLLVTKWANNFYLENITRQIAFQELQEVKSFYLDLCKSFREIKEIVTNNDLKVEYHVAYDTGKSGVGICSEIDGIIDYYIK